MKRTRLIGLLFLLPWLHPSLGASYDCAQARTWVERAICDTAQLSELDSQLGERYLSVRNNAKVLDPVRYRRLIRDQRAWLRQRNRCTNLTCLADRYETRLQALDQLYDDLCVVPYGRSPCID